MGAETGYRLLWLLPMTTVMLVVVLEMAARMGAISGQGLGDLIRDDFGLRWTLVAMLILLLANGANIVAEFAGAAAALEIFGIPRFVTVVVVAVGIWCLVVFASYRIVERVFLSVAVVFVAYIVSAFLAGPDWGEVGRSLITPNMTGADLPLVVAVIGTTVTPYMFVFLQSSVADKGIGPEELPETEADAALRDAPHVRRLHRTAEYVHGPVTDVVPGEHQDVGCILSRARRQVRLPVGRRVTDVERDLSLERLRHRENSSFDR